MKPSLRIITLTLGFLMAGLLAGCATTPTSTPTPSPSVSREATNVTCAENTAFCFPGDKGPGEGIIFSVVPGNGQATILEVASNGWTGSWWNCQYCGGVLKRTSDIGNDWQGAVTSTAAYTGGGKTDWRLPTIEELTLLYEFSGRNSIGGFGATNYWSSSQKGEKSAYLLNLGSGQKQFLYKEHIYWVRPVRTAQSPLS